MAWLTQLLTSSHLIARPRKSESVRASDGHRRPAPLSVAAAAWAQEVSADPDDYQTDRKAFCFWGYLAACRGHDANTGGQKGRVTVTALSCCSQSTADDNTAIFNHDHTKKNPARINRKAAHVPPSIQNLFILALGVILKLLVG